MSCDIKVLHVLAEYISQTMKLGTSLPPYRTFTLDELKEATNNFDASTLITESVDGQVSLYKVNIFSPFSNFCISLSLCCLILHLSHFSVYIFQKACPKRYYF